MMYPFMTLNDGTEIVHSEMRDGKVKVYVESPAGKDGFHNGVCWLPGYKWTDVRGYTQAEICRYDAILRSTGHLILEFSQNGGILNAAVV